MTPSKQSPLARIIRLFVVIVLLLHSGNSVAAVAKPPRDNLKIFTEILAIIEKNYAEPVASQKLIQEALNGMLQSLDPHSAYLTADMYKELMAETKGRFGGIGIETTFIDEVLTVISPIEGAPAYKAGIRAGDQIVKIDNKPVKGLSITEVARIKGPPGTKVKITIMRKGFAKPRDFMVTRAIINLQSVSHRKLEHNIGYIRISHFQEKTTNELKPSLQ